VTIVKSGEAIKTRRQNREGSQEIIKENIGHPMKIEGLTKYTFPTIIHNNYHKHLSAMKRTWIISHFLLQRVGSWLKALKEKE
jgi:hypothetical protein